MQGCGLQVLVFRFCAVLLLMRRPGHQVQRFTRETDRSHLPLQVRFYLVHLTDASH